MFGDLRKCIELDWLSQLITTRATLGHVFPLNVGAEIGMFSVGKKTRHQVEHVIENSLKVKEDSGLRCCGGGSARRRMIPVAGCLHEGSQAFALAGASLTAASGWLGMDTIILKNVNRYKHAGRGAGALPASTAEGHD
jgi:hypothetical protein